MLLPHAPRIRPRGVFLCNFGIRYCKADFMPIGSEPRKADFTNSLDWLPKRKATRNAMDFYQRQCNDEETRQRLAEELELFQVCVRCQNRDYPPIEEHPEVSEYLCRRCSDQVDDEVREAKAVCYFGAIGEALERAKTFRFSTGKTCPICGMIVNVCKC